MSSAKDLISDKINLPSPPAIALKILSAVQQEENSFNKLAEIVMADPALAVRILKVANSSLYGIPKTIDSLSQATALIGTQTLKNIALSFVIVKSFQNVPQGRFDLEHFWRRSISTAVAVEVLAEQVGLKDRDIFVAGLLLEIGVLVIFLSDSNVAEEIFDEKRVSGSDLYELEQARLGFHHGEVGHYLLTAWNLPDTISEPILYHHSREAPDKYRAIARLLGCAGRIASIYHGTESTRRSIEVYRQLEGDYQITKDKAAELIDVIGEKSREIMDLFAIDPGDLKPFSQIIQEANDELRRLNYSYEPVVLELKHAKRNAELLARELQLANDRLRKLAFRDELTDLFNHRYFHEALESELSRARRYRHPLSLLMADIDHFKKVNDSYGHLIGDRMLREVGQTLSKLVRHCDIVSRYGGEEFAIILPETGMVGAKVIAQRVRRGIEQLCIDCEGRAVSVTISIGLACLEDSQHTLARAEFIARSDAALYRAKDNGRNRVETDLPTYAERTT